MVFSPEKLARLFLLKEVKPSPECKMINLVSIAKAFSPTPLVECMTKAIKFSRQNDAGLCARTS